MATWHSGALACAWLSTLLWKGPLLTGEEAHQLHILITC